MTMSKGNDYWYFRFTDRFLDDLDTTQMTTLPNGYEMFFILLQLYSLAIKEKGYFSLPNVEGKPDYVTLAKHTKHDVRTMEFSIKYFLSVGLLEIIEGAEKTVFYTPKLKNMIGKSSKEADKKRLEYAAQHDKLPGGGELKPESAEGEKSSYGYFKNVMLLESEYKELKKRYKNADEIIRDVSYHKQKTNTSYANDYAAVLSFARKDGIEKPDEDVKRRRRDEYNARMAACGFPPDERDKEILGIERFKELEAIAEKAYWEERKKD